MAKSKYKKVLPPGAIIEKTNVPPLKITVSSDGNTLEFVSYSGGVYTYKYILSNTKQNQYLTMNDDQFKLFMMRNQQITPVPFEKFDMTSNVKYNGKVKKINKL